MPTQRSYWEDDHRFTGPARVAAIAGDEITLDSTLFYPGGGGQPADTGRIVFPQGAHAAVLGSRADEDGNIWHKLAGAISAQPGDTVTLELDVPRRLNLMRYHTVLHILNTVVLEHYSGWITGAQIGEQYSRIDFKLDSLSPELCRDIEAKVNAVITAGHKLEAFFLPEAEFAARPELLRTLEVKPPVLNGQVRVVSIVGFDAQACGGTHLHNTSELGRLEIFKTENKGKINKRLYVRLLDA